MSILALLGTINKDDDLADCIRREIEEEQATLVHSRRRRNVRTCSETLRNLFLRVMDDEIEWCFKTRFNGTKSTVLKATHTLLREGVAKEIKNRLTSDNANELLLLYAETMSIFAKRVFRTCPRLEVDFIDKFYKFQLQSDVLQHPVFTGHLPLADRIAHVANLMTTLRGKFTVSPVVRIQQQDRTKQNRDNGLRDPFQFSRDAFRSFVDSIWSDYKCGDGSSDMDEYNEKRVVAAFCLLQLGIGGRARDLLLVNVASKVDECEVRVGHLTKRRHDSSEMSITKPVLRSVFGRVDGIDPSDSFLSLLCQARYWLVTKEVHGCNIRPEWIEETVISSQQSLLHLKYDKQWDKSSAVESLVQTMSAKMRRYLAKKDKTLHLFDRRGKGTHQLRKLYVACSHDEYTGVMKEPAWAQKVLGHAGYDTSLLYMSMSVQPDL